MALNLRIPEYPDRYVSLDEKDLAWLSALNNGKTEKADPHRDCRRKFQMCCFGYINIVDGVYHISKFGCDALAACIKADEVDDLISRKCWTETLLHLPGLDFEDVGKKKRGLHLRFKGTFQIPADGELRNVTLDFEKYPPSDTLLTLSIKTEKGIPREIKKITRNSAIVSKILKSRTDIFTIYRLSGQV